MRIMIILLLVAPLAFSADDFSYITGEQSGVLKKGNYIVTGNIYVLKKQHLRIEAGARLYFEQYSSITVIGSLECAGSIDDPVVLTSVKEFPKSGGLRETPEPFDWNGVELTADATSCVLVNTKIRNCIFGLKIKSGLTAVSLERVEFYNNGYSSLTRDGKNIEVQPGAPFSITWNINTESPVERMILTSEGGKSDKKPAKTRQKRTTPPSRKNQGHGVLKWSLWGGGGACAITGGAMLVTGLVSAGTNKDKYTKQTDPELLSYYRQRYFRDKQIATIGGFLLGAGTCAIGVTFFIP